MPDKKELIIEAKLDVRQLASGLDALKQAVGEIVRTLSQASGGLIGAAVGQAGGGPQPGVQHGQNQVNSSNALSKAVQDNKRLLDSLKNASEDTLRNMADMATRKLGEEKDAVVALNTELEKLNKQYAIHRRIEGSLTQAGFPAERGGMGDQIGARIADVQQKVATREGVIEGLQSIINKGGGGGGGEPPPGTAPPGSGSGRFMPWLIRGGIAASAFGAAATLANESTRFPMEYARIAAQTAAGFGQAGIAASQGDMSTMLAMATMSPEERGRMGWIGKSYGANTIGTLSNLSINPARLFGIGDVINSFRHIDEKQINDMFQNISLVGQNGPNRRMIAQSQIFQGLAPSLLAAYRMMGVNEGGYNSFMNPLAKELSMQTGELESIFGGVMQQAGRRSAYALTGQVGRAVAGGEMTSAVASALASAGAIGGDTTILGLLSSQTSGAPSKNLVAQFLASQAISGFGSAGDLGGIGGLLLGGTGNDLASNSLAVHQNIKGLGGFGGVGSVDGFAQGIMLLSAMQSAPGVGRYGQRALATQLNPLAIGKALSGDTSIGEYWNTMGVTGSMAKGTLQRAIMANVRSRLATNEIDVHTPFYQALRGIEATGGDVAAYLARHPGNVSGAGAVLGNTFGYDFDTGKGMARAMLPGGKRLRAGAGGGVGGRGSAAEEQIQQQMELLLSTLDALTDKEKGLGKFVDAVHQNAKTFEEISAMIASGKVNAAIATEMLKIFAEGMAQGVKLLPDEVKKQGTQRHNDDQATGELGKLLGPKFRAKAWTPG